MKTGLIALVAAMLLLAGTVSAQAQKEFQMPRTEAGWTDLPKLLVPSDGSRSLGNTNADFNDTREQPGSLPSPRTDIREYPIDLRPPS
jgi:hypothetical protein